MIANLTGLRFYMALWVVIYHIDIFSNPIISKGYLGVDVFFILSGYILAHVYFAKFSSGYTKREYFTFIKKRFARVYPLHLITMIGAVFFLILLSKLTYERPLYLDHILFQTFMIHSWGVVDSSQLNYPSWSISAEWFAYLFLFPVFTWGMKKNRFLIPVTICLSFLFLQWYVYTYLQNSFGQTLSIGIIRILPEFLFGGFVYVLFSNKRTTELITIISLMVFLGCFGLLAFETVDYLLVALIPLVLIILHKGWYPVNFLCGSKGAIWLGEISYAMYMTHFFAIKINGILYKNYFSFAGKIGYLMGAIVLTLLFSTISYYLLEIPARKWINSLNKKIAK